MESIRGAALKPFVGWYVDAFGRGQLDRALARLSPRELGHFEPSARDLGLSAMRWYPAPLIHRMLDGLLDGLDTLERRTIAASGADHTMAAGLDGVVGMAFRAMASPQVCALVGPRLWHAFYSSGRVRIDAPGSRCHRMDVTGWPGHHAFLCQINNEAGRAIYRAAGCSGATTEHAACIARGDRSCVYVIRW